MDRRRIFFMLSLGGLALGLTGVSWLTRRPMPVTARDPESIGWDEPIDAPLVLVAGRMDGGSPRPDGAAMVTRGFDIPSDRPAERVDTPELESAEAYLLVGVDHTRGRWGRADSILVAFFDDASGHVGVVSIPRDLLVEVPDHGPARINATLRIAMRQERDPLRAIRERVQEVLDTPIDHVLVGDLEAFERSVDALGGIVVNVPCSIRDRFVDPRVEGGRRWLDVAAGQRRLDGITAAMYVRSRHGRSDWDRARRQQAVLAGLRSRLRAIGPAGWLPVVGQALQEGVFTTMSRLELIALARRVSRVRPERTHGVLIGTRQTRATRTADGRYVLEPDYPAIDEALAGLFEAPSPGSRPARKRCPDPDVALRFRSREAAVGE